MNRPDGREFYMLRPIKITRNFLEFAEGAVLIECGKTKVLCTATVEDGVPPFLINSGRGWLTAEYGMLPKSCKKRVSRGPSGRSQEIQRLIGRSLRTAVDLHAIGERTIRVDCDVLQADGGTRTASITGACVAVYDALNLLKEAGVFPKLPLKNFIAAISVGVLQDQSILDMDAREDSAADVDFNVIMNDKGEFVEMQGTGEEYSFSREQLDRILELAEKGIQTLFGIQKKALGLEK